jgi:hypothetical protein
VLQLRSRESQIGDQFTSAREPGFTHWPAITFPTNGGDHERQLQPPSMVNGLNAPGLVVFVPRRATARASSQVSDRLTKTPYLFPGLECRPSFG